MAFESSVTQQKGTQTVLDLGDKTSTFSKVLFKADKKDLDSRLHQICSWNSSFCLSTFCSVTYFSECHSDVFMIRLLQLENSSNVSCKERRTWWKFANDDFVSVVFGSHTLWVLFLGGWSSTLRDCERGQVHHKNTDSRRRDEGDHHHFTHIIINSSHERFLHEILLFLWCCSYYFSFCCVGERSGQTS